MKVKNIFNKKIFLIVCVFLILIIMMYFINYSESFTTTKPKATAKPKPNLASGTTTTPIITTASLFGIGSGPVFDMSSVMFF